MAEGITHRAAMYGQRQSRTDRGPGLVPSRPRLGILLSNLADEYQSFVLEGAREAARARGAHLFCFMGGAIGAPGSRTTPQNRIFSFASRENVDALIVVAGSIGLACGPAQLADFCRRFEDLPICTIAGELPGAASVAINNQAGMRDVIGHLIEVHGRRRIAFIRGPETNQEAEDRFAAYRDALSAHGITLESRWIAPGNFSAESGTRAIEILFDERGVGGSLDAIVAADDTTAVGALAALAARRIRVPSQIAVVGFDDLEESRYCSHPLTTVRQPIRDQGAAAVRVLLQRLAGEETDDRILLPTTTIVRRSCGCHSGDGRARDARLSVPMPSGFEAELIRRRQLVTAELSRAARGSLTALPGWNDLLIKSFTDQLKTGSERFSIAFRSLLSSLLEAGADASAVHDVITVLRRQMLGCLDPDPELRDRAENMFQEVRLITSEALERVQAGRRARAERLACVVAAASYELSAVHTTADLRSVVERRFRELGISSCYISVFESGAEPDQPARVLAAFDDDVADREPLPAAFRSGLLAPEAWLKIDRSRSFVVTSVHFDGIALGIMAVSADAAMYVYDALGDMIGTAVDRVRRLSPVVDTKAGIP